ncbi:MAG: hypothetical protein M5U12_09775 [Verrucomicrobia bacterium]|nr:hypothetical protein [Verrucomicrobiota bacterium]
MATDASQPEEGPGRDLEALLAQTLLLDLEVSHEGRIRKLGAVLGPTTLARAGSGLKPGAGDELATLARSAWCVLGHNLVRHDLPALHDTCPQHPLLRLPVIDTLVLSPLTFPENPYHRLVKDYKLVRESVNDPVADARQAAALFGDEFRALAGLRRTEPRLFELLHFLLATPDAAPDPPPTAWPCFSARCGPACRRAIAPSSSVANGWPDGHVATHRSSRTGCSPRPSAMRSPTPSPGCG